MVQRSKWVHPPRSVPQKASFGLDPYLRRQSRTLWSHYLEQSAPQRIFGSESRRKAPLGLGLWKQKHALMFNHQQEWLHVLQQRMTAWRPVCGSKLVCWIWLPWDSRSPLISWPTERQVRGLFFFSDTNPFSDFLQTPARCPAIQFRSDTIYLETASDSTSSRAQSHRTALACHKSESPVLLTDQL